MSQSKFQNTQHLLRYNVNKTIYPNGEIFYGILTEKHRFKQGFGELHTLDNRVIVGEWDMDQLNGVAIVTCRDGKETICNYYKGMKQGIGEIRVGPRVYKGEFKADRRSGVGIFIDKDVEVRKGYFLDGEHHGYGEVQIFQSGNIYKGHFQDGKPHGIGMETTIQDTYFGEYENGQKSGYGKLEESDGFKFFG